MADNSTSSILKFASLLTFGISILLSIIVYLGAAPFFVSQIILRNDATSDSCAIIPVTGNEFDMGICYGFQRKVILCAIVLFIISIILFAAYKLLQNKSKQTPLTKQIK